MRLQTFSKTTSVSTAEYERSFSGMNLCTSPQRAALHNDHVSTSLITRLVAPRLFKFNHDEKVKTWLSSSSRCAEEAAWRKEEEEEMLTAMHCGTSYRLPW
jgi:hypothetical protein